MGKRSNRASAITAPRHVDGTIPAVGGREPCPCGSGRRYKACHGRDGATGTPERVLRPFAGLAGECDWVALREIVPAATAPLTLRDGTSRNVSVVTVLPMAWAALVRQDSGDALLGLQTGGASSGDVSRDVAAALERALEAEQGTPIETVSRPGPGRRLQDLLDADAPLEVTVHDGFDFWVEGIEDAGPEVQASMERANSAVVPTRRLSSVEAAYWCRLRDREHLRWVLPHEEERLLDAMARLNVAGADRLGEGTKYVGSFRALGLLVPVWDLAPGTEAAAVEEPAAAYRARLDEALADDRPLTAEERRARSGLQGRQVTLR